MTGTITRATGGSAISGASVQAVLTGVVKGSATTAANGTYSIGNLDPGTYDVRVSASGFSLEVRQGISMSANVTTTVNASLSQPGSVSGTVTQAGGSTPISGAAVALYQGSVQKGGSSTDGAGAYSVASLHPGVYTLQVASAGYRTKEQGVTIAETTNATANASLDLAPAGQVTYVYDELNRLVSVVDPSGDAAHYKYDAVGNLVGIVRAGATTVSISEFTPNGGPIGSAVTIDGTGFSSTPSSNTVTFNGTAATVSAATPNQLTVTVPPAATTGPIAVTSPSGSATSSANFTITAATSGPPTITGFTPTIVGSGSGLTINGTNFNTDTTFDRLTLNLGLSPVTTATATALATTIQGTATSGKVSVMTPAGSALSTADLFVTPPGYTASQVEVSTRTTIGSTQTVAINNPSKIGLLVFDGLSGQRMSTTFSAGSINGGTATLYDPAGRLLRTTSLDFLGRFFDAVTLPASATYTLLVAPTSAPPASTDVTLYIVQDLTGTLTPGTASSLTFTTPGQNARLSFAGTAAHRYSVVTSYGNPSSGNTTTAIVAPDGVSLLGESAGILTHFIEPVTFGTTATYALTLDPDGKSTGTAIPTVYDVPADLSGTITPTTSGSSQLAALTTPGQNALYTIGTPANARVSLGVSSGPSSVITIKNSNGSTAASGSAGIFNGFIEPWTFGAGQTMVVDPSLYNSGNLTLTLYDVPPDTTGSVTIGGAAATVTSVAGGQKGTLTFTGAASQQVTVHVSNSTVGQLTVSLLGTDGTTVLASQTSIFSSFNLSTTLPSTPPSGTYTIVVDPQGADTGHADINVTSP
jgi:YD repeat-containing protein